MADITKFVALDNLQEYFVDKDTGEALSGGIVTFYKDSERTTLKDIYQKTGSPPDYTFTTLPNPMTLSSVGTPQDAVGNDVIIYAYPYNDQGEGEQYYMTVHANDGYGGEGVFQFSRAGFPGDIEGQEELTTEIYNHIGNGQFLIHNNILPDGKLTSDITYLTPDGWIFVRGAGSSASDYVQFIRIGSPSTMPTGHPRYRCKIYCSSPYAGDVTKSIRIKFIDVNKFLGQTMTFSFTAYSSIGVNVSVKIVKNYGTGGSAEEIIDVETISISTSEQIYNVIIEFPIENTGTIGNYDDDSIQIGIFFPVNSLFDFYVSDVILTPDVVDITGFPTTTNKEFIYRSLAASMSVPDYNGNSLYLGLMYTKSGLAFDDRHIGGLVFLSTDTLPKGMLWADGSQYSYSGISSDGIYYSRLADKYWSETEYRFLYGTGSNFVVMDYWHSDQYNYISLCSTGVVTHVSDGSPATGFTFATQQEGTLYVNYICKITFLAASSITSGSYFKFYNLSGSMYYVWYKKDGVGTDPAPGGAILGIMISITGTDTAIIVNQKTMIAVNKLYFAVPDYRAMFIRGLNKSRTDPFRDADVLSRLQLYSGASYKGGDSIGTAQYSQNLQHTHTYQYRATTTGVSGTGNGWNGVDANWPSTTTSGGTEARPNNIYSAIAIYY